MADLTIHFEIHDASGSPLALGYFERGSSVVTKITDENGTATTTYYGPLSTELTANTTVYIAATVEWEGSDIISKTASIYIIREADLK